ncbi:oleate hydratase [Clostridium luticellarii]
MLAFQPYHSLIEMKRYTVRFMQHLDGIEHLKCKKCMKSH